MTPSSGAPLRERTAAMDDKKKPVTALVRRTRPDLSQADLASLIYRSNHWFDGRRLAATFDMSEPAALKVENPEDSLPRRAYLVYCENTQAFIGIVRGERFSIEEQVGYPRLRLMLYPMAEA